MARIIYAAAGEGFGHASRVHLIAQRFLDAGHDVLFVSSHRGLLYLRQYYGERVKEIFGLTYEYSRGYVQPLATICKNVPLITVGRRMNKALFDHAYRPFQPDLVVTDFEPFSAWWAWYHRVPLLSLDNEHMLTMCRLEHRLRNVIPRITSTLVTRLHCVGARAYVMINFFKAPLRHESAVLAPPVVREVVTTLTPSNQGHIVVYSTTGAQEARLRDTLSKFPDQKFLIYGFNKAEEACNCIFKERSTDGFLRDLADARGVIASAGFSLMSECLHLRKRMLLLPLAGQYEQIINAHYAQQLGLGTWSPALDEAALGRFLRQIDEPISQDERILWPDNHGFFEILQGVLSHLDPPVSISV
ncbi:MAG: hypothetical protein JW955_18660 [Sedimentisphaerales bacterium]|nr:hypothetical protein [Sedimentisphaerales bacterium]